jgi:hypothetical protein
MRILKAYAKGYVGIKAAAPVETLKQSPLLISWTREFLVCYGNCDSKFIKEDLKATVKSQKEDQETWKKNFPCLCVLSRVP